MRASRPAVIMAILAATVLCSAESCEDTPVTDLKVDESTAILQPDKIEIYKDYDLYPNVVAMCIHGVGFAATTRDASAAALQRIEPWDAANDGWCSR